MVKSEGSKGLASFLCFPSVAHYTSAFEGLKHVDSCAPAVMRDNRGGGGVVDVLEGEGWCQLAAVRSNDLCPIVSSEKVG